MKVVSGDNWSYKTCKVPVKSSPPRNQHPVFLQAGCPSCQGTESELLRTKKKLEMKLRDYCYLVEWRKRASTQLVMEAVCRRYICRASIHSWPTCEPTSHTIDSRVHPLAGPTVWNSLSDSLRDPAVGPDQFRRDLKTHLFEWHCVSFSTSAVFSRNALYKSTFYLLTYLPTCEPTSHTIDSEFTHLWT